MRTLFLILAVAVGGATLLVPATADAKGDALARDVKSIRKAFKREAKESEGSFVKALSDLQKGLNAGTRTPEEAATGFGNLLAFYANSVKVLADDAATGFATSAAATMAQEGDGDLPGAVAGDGGSYDVFHANLHADLATLRTRALKRARRFTSILTRNGQRTDMRYVLGDWEISPRPVPRLGGTFPERDEELRLWGVVFARLDDGRVLFNVFGSAPPTLDNTFDVRLEGTIVRSLGALLSDGGMDVLGDGTWRFGGEIGDPFSGDGVDVGARQINFGVEPFDGGLAGLQPARLVHAAAVSVP